VKIHCLYRDFFIFLRMMHMEGDQWTSFRHYYFDRHRDFLSAVWFGYQGFTERNIRERVRSVRKEDYADIENQLKIYDIEGHTREIILHCRSILHDPLPCPVYLFIGFFSPDGFVLSYGGDQAVCIGLERFHDFRDYDLLLSHEYCHVVMNRRFGAGGETIKRKLVREGLAVYFSTLVYPGRKANRYLFLDEDRFRMMENDRKLMEEVREAGEGEAARRELFSGAGKRFPPRAGYYAGYRLVLDFIRKTNVRDIDFLLRDRNQILIDF